MPDKTITSEPFQLSPIPDNPIPQYKFDTPTIPDPGALMAVPSNQGLSQIEFDTKPSLDKMMQPETFDWEATKTDRYVQNDMYKTLGFDPKRDNEELYGVKQDWGDVTSNALAGSGKLAAATFIEGYKSLYNVWDAVTGITQDNTFWERLRGDSEHLKTLEEGQNSIMDKYAIYHTKESNEELFNKQFFGDLIQQSGFALGAGAAWMTQSWLTAGIGAGLSSTKFASTLANIFNKGAAVRIGEGVSTTAQSLRDLNRLNSIWRNDNVLKSMWNYTKTAMFGEGNTIAKIKEASKLGNYSEAAYIGVGGLRRVLLERNAAVSEAQMEAAQTKGKLMDSLILEYKNRTGEDPSTEELQKIDNLSSDAATDNFKVNYAVISLMNRLQFSNVIDKFSSSKKALELLGKESESKLFDVSGKLATGELGTRSYTKGSFGKLSAIKDISRDFGKGTAASIAAEALGRQSLKWEIGEGVQELIQSGSQDAISAYYTDLYNGKKGPWEKYVKDAAANQASMEGLKTFLMGAVTGRLIAPLHAIAGSAINKGRSIVDKDFKAALDKNKQTLQEDLRVLDEGFKDIRIVLNPSLANLKAQNLSAEEMEKAIRSGDRCTYNNIKDLAKNKFIATAIKHDMFETVLDNIEGIGEHFTDEEFKQAFGIEATETNKDMAKVFSRNLAKDLKEYKKEYDNLWDKFGTPFNPNNYKGAERDLAAIAYRANQDAIELLASNKAAANASLERALELKKKAASIPVIGDSINASFEILSNKVFLDKEIELLEKSIASLGQVQGAAQMKSQEIEQLKHLKAFKEAFDSTDSDITLPDNIQAIYEKIQSRQQLTEDEYNAYEEYEKDIARGISTRNRKIYDSFKGYVNAKNANNYNKTVISEDYIQDAVDLLSDYIKLDQQAKNYTEAFNILANPIEYTKAVGRISTAIQAAKANLLQEAINDVLNNNSTTSSTDTNVPNTTTPATTPASNSYLNREFSFNNEKFKVVSSDDKTLKTLKENGTKSSWTITKFEELLSEGVIQEITTEPRKSVTIDGKTFTEGELLVGNISTTSAKYKNKNVSVFKNDKIKIISIDEANDSITVQIEGEVSTHNLSEFVQWSKNNKWTSYNNLSEIQKFYLQVRNQKVTVQVLKRDNNGKVIYNKGEVIPFDVAGRVVLNDKKNALMFKYIDPNTGRTETIPLNMKYVKSMEGFEEFAAKEQAKQVENFNRQIQILNDLNTESIQYYEENQIKLKETNKQLAELEKDIKNIQAEVEVAKQLLEDNKNDKFYQDFLKDTQKYFDALATAQELFNSYKEQKETLEKQAKAYQTTLDLYQTATETLLESGTPFTAGKNGNIYDSTQEQLDVVSENQISKKPLAFLEKALEDTNNELAVVDQQLDYLSNLIKYLKDIIKNVFFKDKSGRFNEMVTAIEDGEYTRASRIFSTLPLSKIKQRIRTGINTPNIEQSEKEYGKSILKELKQASAEYAAYLVKKDNLVQKQSILIQAVEQKRSLEQLMIERDMLKTLQSHITDKVRNDKYKKEALTASEIANAQASILDPEEEISQEKTTSTTSSPMRPKLAVVGFQKTAGIHFLKDGFEFTLNGKVVNLEFTDRNKSGLVILNSFRYTKEELVKINSIIKELLKKDGREEIDGISIKSIKNDTKVIDNHNGRFFKFVETHATTDLFFQVINKNHNPYGLDLNYLYGTEDAIVMVVVEKTAAGYKAVGLDGKILDNPSQDNLIFQTIPELPEDSQKLTDRINSGWDTTDLTVEQINQLVTNYKKIYKELQSKTSPTFVPITKGNRGLDMVYSIEGQDQKLSVQGRTLEETPDWNNLKHPNGHPVKVVVGTNKNVATYEVQPGRLVIYDEITRQVYRLFNRELVSSEQENLWNLFAELSKIWNSKEEEDKEKRTKILNYLRTSLFWKGAKFEGLSGDFFFIEHKDGVPFLKRNGLGKDNQVVLKFTPETFDTESPLFNQGLKDKFLERIYHQANNIFLNKKTAEGTAVPYKALKVQGDKLVETEYPSYEAYLLGGENPFFVTTTPTYSKDDINSPQKKSSYYTWQYESEAVVNNPKPIAIVTSTEPSIGNVVFFKRTSGKRQVNFKAERLDVGYKVLGVYDLNGKDISDEVLPSGKNIVSYIQEDIDDFKGLEKDPEIQEVFNSKYKSISDFTSKKEEPTPIVVEPEVKEETKESVTKADPVVQSAAVTSKLNMLADRIAQQGGKKDRNYKLATNTAVEKEDFKKVKAWFEKNLPQIPIEVVTRLIDNKAFGQFKDGVVKIYEGASKGTGFHEGFEAVWNSYLTKEQQQEFISLFRKREGTFYNPYSLETKSYSEATAWDVKEMLADEFADYIEKSEIEEPEVKGNKILMFFKKLWSLIKQLFKGHTLNESADLIKNLYSKINSGEFVGASAINYGEGYREIPVSSEMANYAIEGLTAIFFVNLYKNQSNIESIINGDINSSVFSKILNESFDEFEEDLAMDYYQLRTSYKEMLNQEEGVTDPTKYRNLTAEEEQQVRNHIGPILAEKEVILNNAQAVKNEFFKYLEHFGLKIKQKETDNFKESPLAEDQNIFDVVMEKEETANTLGIMDAISINPKKLVTANINILLASLAEREYTSDGNTQEVLNPLGLPKIADFGKIRNTLPNELANVTSMEEGIGVIDYMFEKLDTKYKDSDGNYKPGFLWIRNLKMRLKYQDSNGKDIDESQLKIEDIQLRLGFLRSFTKILMEPTKYIIGPDNLIYSADPATNKNKDRIKQEWQANASSSVDINYNPSKLLWIDNSTGAIKFNPASAEMAEAKKLLESRTDTNHLKGLELFGIKLSGTMSDIFNSEFFYKDSTTSSKKLIGRTVIQDALNTLVYYASGNPMKVGDEEVYLTSLDQVWDNKHIGSSINELLALEEKLSQYDNILTYLNSAGKTQYGITNPSGFGNIINNLNNASSLEEFMESTPHVCTTINGRRELLPYIQRSELLKPGGILFDKNGKKKPGSISYKLMLGAGVSESEDGEDTDKLTFADRLINQLNSAFQLTFFAGINSDKSSEFGIKLPKAFISLADSAVIKNNSKIQDIYINQLKDEFDAAFWQRIWNEQIAVYKDEVYDLGFYRDIIGQPLVNKFKLEVLGGKAVSSKVNVSPLNIDLRDTQKINKAKSEYDAARDLFIKTYYNQLTDKIEEYLTNLRDETITNFEKNGLVVASPFGKWEKKYSSNAFSTLINKEHGADFDFQNMDQADLNKLINYLVINQEIAFTEQTKIVYGHPALYKDFAKRSSGATGVKEGISEDPTSIRVMNREYKRIDGKERNPDVHQTFKNWTFADAMVCSSELKNIAEGLYKAYSVREGHDKACKSIGANFENGQVTSYILNKKGEHTGYLKSYAELTEADAQGKVMLDFYRDSHFLAGKWSSDLNKQFEYEHAYEIIKRSSLSSNHPAYLNYTSEMLTWAKDIYEKGNPGVILKPAKPQYFGYATDNTQRTVFLKNAVVPLTWGFVEGTNWESKYIQAQKEQVDIFNFKSGQKVGYLLNEQGKETSLYNEFGNFSVENPPTQELYTRYFGFQTEVPELKDKVVRGSQVTKLIMTNLKINGEWINKEAEEFANEYQEILKELTKIGKEEVLQEFGLEEVESTRDTHEYIVKDVTKLANLLREEAINRDLPNNIIDAIKTVKDGDKINLAYPLDAFPNREKMENIIASIIDSRIISDKMPGKPLVQVASTGYESGNRSFVYLDNGVYKTWEGEELNEQQQKSKMLTSNDLKFYSMENGKIKGMEVYLPWYFEGIKPEDLGLVAGKGGIYMVDSSKIDNRLLEVLGFRIPTQGLNSIESIRIKGFTNPSRGDIIIVPSEMVGKSGSDFDVDKLNTYLPNYKITGKKIIYVDPKTDIQTIYQDWVKERASSDVQDYVKALSKNEVQKIKTGIELARAEIKAKYQYEFAQNKLQNKEDRDYNKDQYITYYENELSTELQGLHEDGKNLFSTLKFEVKQGFWNLVNELENQKVKGVKKLQSIYAYAYGLTQSDSISEKDKTTLWSMIDLYDQELSIWGINKEQFNSKLKEIKENYIQIIKENKQYFKEILNGNLNTVSDLAENLFGHLNQEVYAEIARLSGLPSIEEFSQKSSTQQMPKKYLQNRMITLMKDTISFEENYAQLVTPNGADTLKKLADYINNKKEIVAEDKSRTKLRQFYQSAQTRHIFLTSKQMVGIGALHTTLHTVAQIAGIELSGKFNSEGVYWLYNASKKSFIKSIKSKYNTTTLSETHQKMREKEVLIRLPHKGLRLDNDTDASNRLISELHSEAMSGFVDAAKDPFVFYLNFNLETAGTWLYLEKLGVPIDVLALLHTQPAIVSYFEELTLNKSLVKEANEEKLSNKLLLVKVAGKYLGTNIYEEVSALEKEARALFDKGYDDDGALVMGKANKIVQSMLDLINAYRATLPELDASMLDSNLLGKDGMFQLAVLFDYLEYRQQSGQLSTFMTGISYDNKRTTSITDLRRQQASWTKAIEDGFIKNPYDMMTKTFLGQMQDEKKEALRMISPLFVSLSKNAERVFHPILERINNSRIIASKSQNNELLKRYQNFVLTYIVQNIKRDNNTSKLSDRYDELLFGNNSLASQLVKLKNSKDERIINNPVIKELLGVIPTNATKPKVIQLFSRVLDSYEINKLIDGITDLYDLAVAKNDSELQLFVENLAVASILQSGFQPSKVNFSKILPEKLYSTLVGDILNKYATDTTLTPYLIYRQFHQNNVSNRNIVPKAGKEFFEGLINSENEITEYDYIVKYERTAESRGKRREDVLRSDYEAVLYEKVKRYEEGEDVTRDQDFVKYVRLDTLGTKTFIETSTIEKPSIIKANNKASMQETVLENLNEKPNLENQVMQNSTSNLINFQEHQLSDYPSRTKINAAADATLAIALDYGSAGEKLTYGKVVSQKKLYIPISLSPVEQTVNHSDASRAAKINANSNGLTITPEIVKEFVNNLNKLQKQGDLFGSNVVSLNIAGNGIYTFKGKYTQEQLDSYVLNLLKQAFASPELKVKVGQIRTGGQTGIDEAGAKAGLVLGIPTTILAPKGWLFRDINSRDIRDEKVFKERFVVKNSISTPIEGLNERLNALGFTKLIIPSDYYEGGRPQGRLNAFKDMVKQVSDNLQVLANQDYSEFAFLSKDVLNKLEALKPLVNEFRDLNMKLSHQDLRTSAHEKRYAELSREILENYTNVLKPFVKEQLGKDISIKNSTSSSDKEVTDVLKELDCSRNNNLS